MNYKQQLEVIQGLFIPSDTAMRLDCPFCNGKNTLSVDTTTNNLSWYCFHASCSAKGKHQGEKNMNYVNATFKQKEESSDTEFKMPDSFKSTFSNGPNFTASDQPVDKLSIATGLKPLFFKALHACEPM